MARPALLRLNFPNFFNSSSSSLSFSKEGERDGGIFFISLNWGPTEAIVLSAANPAVVVPSVVFLVIVDLVIVVLVVDVLAIVGLSVVVVLDIAVVILVAFVVLSNVLLVAFALVLAVDFAVAPSTSVLSVC